MGFRPGSGLRARRRTGLAFAAGFGIAIAITPSIAPAVVVAGLGPSRGARSQWRNRSANACAVVARRIVGVVMPPASSTPRRLPRRPRGVWADRYHRHDLRTPREVRNALAYVLGNYKKHGLVARDAPTVDPFSSAIWFDGWAVRLLRPWKEDKPPVHAATTWLLTTGWHQKHGLLDPNDAPG